MPKVLIPPAPLAHVEARHLDVLRSAGFELIFNLSGGQLNEDELLAALPGVVATIAGSEPYTPRVFAAHPQLRAVARAGVGYDAVDLPAATAAGVAVAIAPGTNQDSVAEHTFCLILALTKHLISQHIGTREARWPRGTNLPVRGKTLGIAGLGRIGKAVALRGEAFYMKLLAYEPFPDHQFLAQHKVTLVTLDKLLAESDYLTVHVPLTPESKHVINKKTMALMK